MKPNELVGLSAPLALKGMSVHEFLALSEPLKHKDVYFYLNCMKKNPFVTGDDLTLVTLKDFYDAEEHSGRYNVLFEQLLAHPTLQIYLRIWQRAVRRIMGEFSWGRPRVTSGATSNTPRGATPIERFKDTQMTVDLKFHLDHVEFPYGVPWDSCGIGLGVGECVPKTAKIGRFICKPCSGNAFIQTSLGQSLRQRLLRQGIDFTYAQDVHKRLAKVASIKGHLVTDDQKWASPLIYRSLVQYLVSPEWFIHLDAARDKHILMPDGTVHTLHQFATQGNGFCFELESIIFYGLLQTSAMLCGMSARDPNIKVFGDDLIYPKEMLGLVRAIGRNVGFITNVDKSFSEGPFRESCGGDYLDGVDVRPIYLNRDINCPYSLTIMANQVLALLKSHDEELPLMRMVWRRLVSRIYSEFGRSKVLFGPDWSQGLHGFDYQSRVQSNKWGTEFYKTWEQAPVEFTHFKAIARGTEPKFLLRMLSSGYGKGMGSLMVPEQRLRKDVFGPPKPRTARYPKIPKAGTAYEPKIVDRELFFFPSDVDETKPLSVFDVLPRTRAPERLYARSYGHALIRDKVRSYSDLAKVLGRILEEKRKKEESLKPLHIDL